MNTAKHVLREFVRREDGLVTVEWVALSAALVVGAIAVGWIVMNNMKTPANTIGTQITTAAEKDPGTAPSSN